MKKYFLLVLLIALTPPVFAQQEKDQEVSSEIKELSDFHDVIYQIWHNGWPEKDIKLLISLTPDVEAGFVKIKEAKLPGILREKKLKWEEGLKKFENYVEEYKSTSAKKDSVGLLNAAEKLHAQYEALVRVLKPVMKEVDEFHQVLYMLYHYYLPEYNYEKIKESAAGLKAKFEVLEKAELPKKYESKKEKFYDARTQLGISVAALNVTVLKGDNKEEIKKAAEYLHTKYEELEEIFK